MKIKKIIRIGKFSKIEDWSFFSSISLSERTNGTTNGRKIDRRFKPLTRRCWKCPPFPPSEELREGRGRTDSFGHPSSPLAAGAVFSPRPLTAFIAVPYNCGRHQSHRQDFFNKCENTLTYFLEIVKQIISLAI